MPRFLRNFRKAVFLALEHDVLNTAKAAAYSGMLMFFPAFIVLTALVAKAPEGPTVVGEIRWVSGQILPADTVRLMLSTMQARNPHPARLILSGISLSVFAGLGLMLTLMEGFRRAYRLPRSEWGFWERRLRALFLVFIVLVPLALATLLLVFGRAIELWMVFKGGHQLRHVVLFLWRLARWTLAFCHEPGRTWRALSFRNQTRRTLAARDAGRRGRQRGVVSGDACLRLVRHPDRRLHHFLRVIWRGDCHAGVALHHVVQRAAGRRTQRRFLPRAQQSPL